MAKFEWRNELRAVEGRRARERSRGGGGGEVKKIFLMEPLMNAPLNNFPQTPIDFFSSQFIE